MANRGSRNGLHREEGFVIDEIFLCDNKKELRNAPAEKKDERPGYDVAPWRRKQKHSWSSKLPSFFIFLVARYKNVSPHQVIISKIRVFTRFLRARVRQLFHFNLLFFCNFPPAHTKSTINFRKIAKGCSRRTNRKAAAAAAAEASSVCEYPHSSLCPKLTAKYCGSCTRVYWTFYLLIAFSYMRRKCAWKHWTLGLWGYSGRGWRAGGRRLAWASLSVYINIFRGFTLRQIRVENIFSDVVFFSPLPHPVYL